jgi:hypothetical protein
MPDEKHLDELTEDLTKLMDFTVNEEILLKRISKYFSPKPKNLADSEEDARAIETKLSQLSQKLGGPPRLFIQAKDDPLPIHDTYCDAAISELVNSFHRSYHTICKTQMYFIAINMFEKHNDVFEFTDNDERKSLQNLLIKRFWEFAEIGFIRLASYWDRVGQLLDFVFFSIRQFERDGFPTVFDRIKVNYSPMLDDLTKSESWERLNNYQKSENSAGLKWLLRRRNLLIHSIHLRDTSNVGVGDEELYVSLFNHIEDTIKNKLKAGNIEQELHSLHSHLSAAATLLEDVIVICNLGIAYQNKSRGAP